MLNALFTIFATLAFFISLNIAKKYDIGATTPLQYQLEKRSYLVATLIKYIFYIKIPLFIFFIYTLDKISLILPGAMCAAGVVNATEYGAYLLLLKLLNLYLFAYWLVLDKEDTEDENQPYVKIKFQLYLALYLLFIIEISLETLMFLSIDIKDVVDCCGAIFSNADGTYMAAMLNMPITLLLGLFYGVYMMIVLLFFLKKDGLFALFNLLFLLISLMSLISFFGLYIYEMPTHHCPFCFLQKDYNYIGYLLYFLLFVGTFYGITVGVIYFVTAKRYFYYKIALILNTFYVVVVTFYPILYYIKNSVLF